MSEKTFLQKANQKTFDLKHRQTINFNIGKYDKAVQRGMTQYNNHDLARSRAAYIKTKAIENLDKYLIEFEEKFTANGGKVIWAEDIKEAQKAVWKILEEVNASSVVKSKSMTTEEIELNEFLEARNIEVVETDLGEYIVQLAGQKPYHIVTPAMHLSRKEIGEIFHEKLSIPLTDNAEELTGTARYKLREKYLKAEVGITGANFLIADTGSIAITENEGNARLSVTFPNVHIAIAGIEKILPEMKDLSLFWPLLSTSGTGQKTTVYNSLISGPKQYDETDGPKEMYVILLDNGRSKLLADTQKRQSLNCIRCGACLNACPVYKNIGGHTYETTYSGPIGSVITPQYKGLKNYKHLSYASSLCGACSSVCPVRIDIHNLLLANRKQSIEEGMPKSFEKFAFKMWKKGMLNRKLMNGGNAGIKNFFVRQFFGSSWGKRREMFQIPKKSFNQLWHEKNKP